MKTILQMKAEACVDAFDEAMRRNPGVPVMELFKIAARYPAPRFYCTWEVARKNVSAIERGRFRHSCHLSSDMYIELHRRWKLSGAKGYVVLQDIIMEPAPGFYLAEETFRCLVYRTLRKKRRKAK